MSQTVTYKTKYKSLDAIKRVLDQLIAKGTFGKNAKLDVKQPDEKVMRDTGVYYHYEREKKANIIMRVKDGGDEYFKQGFYDKGFAIARDPVTKEIELVFDYNSSRDANTEKAVEAVKKHVDDMLKTGALAISTEKSLRDIGANVKVNHVSDTKVVIEGEFTAEQLREIIGNQIR